MSSVEHALQIIADHGGTIRTREALAAGIHPRTLYSLRDNGSVEMVTRGLYRLAHLPPVGDPDLAIVAGRIPHGVVCLTSALALHELTTQIPHDVHLAIPRSARYPSCHDVPLAVYRFAIASYEAGVVEHDVGGVRVRVYDPEKTIADCFKYRNKIGLDIVTEALATYRLCEDQSRRWYDSPLPGGLFMKKNVAASVHQRLLNYAQSQKLRFNEILQRYALERWLYRLSISDHAERFVLLGGLVPRVPLRGFTPSPSFGGWGWRENGSGLVEGNASCGRIGVNSRRSKT